MAQAEYGQYVLDFDAVPQQLLSADEIFAALDEDRFRRLKEDSRFERKKVLTPLKRRGRPPKPKD